MPARVKTFFRRSLLALVGLSAPAVAFTDADMLEEVIVTAEFRPVGDLDLAASISVFDSEAINERGALHLEQLLNLAPNVNLSSGASRGRFIQIRGIGERSQFVEPINPSVGLVIDGIDFTGIGGAAVTMDLKQVEILRGPQGTLFGANALAGLVNMVSKDPGDTLNASADVILGNHALRSLTAAVGGPASNTMGYRLAVQANRSDGFIDNIFLDRVTNDINERSARGRFDWQAHQNLELGFTVFYTDVDNGYDAFSLDNTRETYSDNPGHDRLKALAGALTADWKLTSELALIALLSHVDADTEYGYDEDWSHRGICTGTPCDSDLWGFDWWYDSTDNYLRNNSNTSLDLRAVSSSPSGGPQWVAGLYLRDQSQELMRQYTYASGDFGSLYDTRNLAIYGQIDWPVATSWKWVAGLRLERRDWDYKDTSPSSVSTDAGFAQDNENDWGGKLALEYRSSNETLLYALISRGYKAGGYNTALASELPELEDMAIEIPAQALIFDTETLWNYELGMKGQWLDNRLRLTMAAFYQDRHDMQLKQSIVVPADPQSNACPCNFVDSLQNAAGGSNYGLEFQGSWLASDRITLFASLGLLRTRYRDYQSFTHAEADLDNGIPYDMSGRDQAHAPRYQYTAGVQWYLTNTLSAQVDFEGKDDAFASASHNERLASYHLLNMRIAWETGRWQLAAWARNLTDEDVQTRGFGGFGNDPRKLYATEPYYQLGEPRSYGITIGFRY